MTEQPSASNKNTGVFMACGFMALFMFVFFALKCLTKERADEYFPDSSGFFCFVVFLFGVAGFFAFHFVRVFFKRWSTRRAVIISSAVVFFAALLGVAYSGDVIIVEACLPLMMFIIGAYGGFVFLYFARCVDENLTGRATAAAFTAAAAGEFALGYFMLDTRTVLIMSAATFFSLLIYYLCQAENRWVFRDARRRNSKAPVSSGALRLFIVCACVVALAVVLNRGAVTDATRSLGDYPLNRLFFLLGTAVSGVLADIQKRSFMPLFTALMLLAFSISSVFLTGSSVFISLFYLNAGFSFVFIIITFCDACLRTDFQTIFAGLGFAICCLFTGVSFLCSDDIFTVAGSTGTMLLTLLLAVCVSVLVFVGEKSHKTLAEGDSVLATEEGIFENYAKKYFLTKKECALLLRVIREDKSVEVLANEMGVSHERLQKNLCEIYDKTETRSRMGVIRAFNEYKNKLI